MRLRLVPAETNWDFFGKTPITFGGVSALLMVASVVAFFAIGLNFGIDFKGGTTIRTESTQAVDVGVYRDALAPPLGGLGDVSITQSRREFRRRPACGADPDRGPGRSGSG